LTVAEAHGRIVEHHGRLDAGLLRVGRQSKLLIEPGLKANQREVMDAVIRGAKGGLLKKTRGILGSDDGNGRRAVDERNQIRRGCRAGAGIEHLEIEIAGFSRG
jgi:hypothetical protein